MSFIISTSYQNQWIGGGPEAHKNMYPYLLKFVDLAFVVNVDVSKKIRPKWYSLKFVDIAWRHF